MRISDWSSDVCSSDLAALVDFSLEVVPGETVAIVGPSGAGKTTLFQLVQRFYDPQQGVVKVDGTPLPKVDPAALRARIASVPQEILRFAAPARHHLSYGRWAARDREPSTAGGKGREGPL